VCATSVNFIISQFVCEQARWLWVAGNQLPCHHYRLISFSARIFLFVSLVGGQTSLQVVRLSIIEIFLLSSTGLIINSRKIQLDGRFLFVNVVNKLLVSLFCSQGQLVSVSKQ
jgi:hypothetical protein